MLLMIVTLSLIAGCASGSRTSGWCRLNDPIYLTQQEAQTATRERKESIVSHNEFGADRCGWDPV